MSRIAYVDGRYVAHHAARVHVEDRGCQFADAVYEVWPVRAGRLWDHDGHLARLRRSLAELAMRPPMSDAALTTVIRELVRRNRVRHGVAYLQISRGVAPRDHVFPAGARPTVVATARAIDAAKLNAKAARGIAIITAADQRWARCDVKTVGLLPNVLARQAARDAGADDVWLLDDAGCVTEGAAANAWIVTPGGDLITRDLSTAILPGVTRAGVLDAARDLGLVVAERAFTRAELEQAREAFQTSAGAGLLPVVRVDGRELGAGKPGPAATALRARYMAAAAQVAAG